MGISFATKGKKNLYEFWSEKVTNKLNEDAKKNGDSLLVNCASNEYSKVIDKKKLELKIVTPIFKEKKASELKMIGLFAKRARGMMARFIIENQTKKKDDLKDFSFDGYKFESKLSSESEFVFVR